ncbi:MAG: fibronectin type III domain-containing protein, partial [Gammaproteobacteria bacterium]
TDFEVETKFDSAVTAKYQMQGITIEQDNANLIRIDFLFDGASTKVYSASISNGTATKRFSATVSGGAPKYLRVKRAGNEWTASYSNDGTSWATAGAYTHALSVTSVGLFGGNVGSPVPAHTTLIDYFMVDGIAPGGGGSGGGDTTPPVISAVQAASITTDSATITWTTDEASNSVVDYGTTTSYGSTGSDAAQVTSHTVNLTGLSPNTLYHYRVSSTDGSGNTASSGDLTFTTGNASQQSGFVNWSRLSSSTGDLPVPPVSDGQSGVKVVDLDNNGQMDYVISLWDAAETLVWYRRAGSTYEKYVIDTEQTNISHSEKILDIDGDGDLDLIIGDASSSNTLNWWENPYPNFDPNTPWIRRQVYAGDNFFHDSIWGDFDGDGKEEYISWNQYSKQLLMFEIPADPKASGPWPVAPIFSWATGIGYKGSDAIDINLDGKMDFVGGCSWFEHTGGTSFIQHPIDKTQGYSQVKAAQLIPGGRPEVVCLKELNTGPLNMYEWTGSAWKARTLVPFVDRSHTLQIGDINLDGHLDIMFSEMANWDGVTSPPKNPDAKLIVLYGDGAGNFSSQTVFEGQGYLEGQLDDIDNDGDLDMIMAPFRHHIPRIDMWINQGLATAGDSSAPAINNLQVATTDTTATLTWDTNEISSSRVDYGPNTGYGFSIEDTIQVLTHRVVITNLQPGTAYHFRVGSSDGSGNAGQSADMSFSTLPDGGNPSGMVSDHFDGPLDTGIWSFYDPVGNSTLSMTGSQTSISVPAGSSHDLWTGALNAPRIRQAANNSDFEVEVKFDSAVTTKYQIQGLTVEQDSSNLLRFDFTFDGSAVTVYSASISGGTATKRFGVAITGSVPLYLRLNRSGDQWTISYSYTGIQWINAGSYTHALNVASIGLFAGNSGSPVPAHTVLIDYFAVR